MKRLIVMVMMAVVALNAPAAADPKTKTDGNDVRSPLDIKEVKHGHDGDYLFHKLWTYEAWRSSDLEAGEGEIWFRFNLPGASSDDDDLDRLIIINYRNGQLRAKMYDHENGNHDFLRKVSVNRPGSKSVRIKFKKGQLEPGITRYQWQAWTLYEDDLGDLCGTECNDARPNDPDNWITHKSL